jgi:2-dehydro-3-deoxyglucarate aldolase/4-hydroxy-2-oxoheptanedioate aldolase
MKPPLKERLRRGETCCGTFLLFLGGGDVAEFFAGLGFDYLFLDMEHGAFDLSRIRETILAARASGIAPIVRVSEPQYHLITRVLDAGAEGIIVPRVESSRQCEDLVKFSRYPPHGERGISTFAGHNSFRAIPDVPAFLESRNRDVLLVAQIETRAGVENREAILSVPGIDACLVGTGDLAMSMGHAGQVNHPEVQAAAEQVLAACRERDLIFTIPVRTPEEVARWQEKGVAMLSLSSDGGLLAAGAKQFLSQVKK